MNKKIVIACATVALALSACANKDSYISAKSSGGGGGGGADVGGAAIVSVEQKAVELLEADTQFTAVRMNEKSQELRESIASGQVEPTSMSIPNGQTLEAFKITLLDRTCQEHEKIISVQDKELLLSQSGLVINNFPGIQGSLRLNCLDEECAGLLVRNQQTVPAVAGSLAGAPIAEASIILTRNESGLFQPLQTDNNQFIQAPSLQAAREACLQGQNVEAVEVPFEATGAMETAPVQAGMPAARTRADEDRESAIQRRNTRLAQLDQQITAIEDSLTPQFVNTSQGKEALRRLEVLKSQRAALQGAVQKQTMTEISETYDLQTPKMREAMRNGSTPIQVVEPARK